MTYTDPCAMCAADACCDEVTACFSDFGAGGCLQAATCLIDGGTFEECEPPNPTAETTALRTCAESMCVACNP
jgi:hypothetical protein